MEQLSEEQRGKLAVVVHLNVTKVWDEVKEDLGKIEVSFDLYVTLPPCEFLQCQKIILKSYPNAILLKVEGRGADIGAFLLVLDHLQRNALSYRYILKIHTKMNSKWRRELIEPLVKDLKKCLKMMDEDEKIGMIGARKYLLPTMHGEEEGGEKDPQMRRLAQEVSVRLPSQCFFIAGSIFLIRSEVLTSWTDRLSLKDFVLHRLTIGRPSPTDLTHALERLFGALVSLSGKKILGI